MKRVPPTKISNNIRLFLQLVLTPLVIQQLADTTARMLPRCSAFSAPLRPQQQHQRGLYAAPALRQFACVLRRPASADSSRRGFSNTRMRLFSVKTSSAAAATMTTNMSTATATEPSFAELQSNNDTANNDNHANTSPSTANTAIRTTDIAACAQHLKQGGLVAFPTETVYGLGCNALDEAAIQAVFDAKERPLTDPLIVHVSDAAQAFPLWRATAADHSKDDDDNTNCSCCLEARILQTLCDAFWPGPLTLVAQAAAAVVPDKIMAGTGFVACRSPQHSMARQLLRAANLPLAAPSANKFGHVSPTTAHHVWDDLQKCGSHLWILENTSGETCQVGVESTVAKVEPLRQNGDNNVSYVVTVLRQGAVSASQLEDCLRRAGLPLSSSSNSSTTSSVTVTSRRRATADHVTNVAPGQTIRHYSPHVPSYLVSSECIAQERQQQQKDDNDTAAILNEAVVLDFAGRLAAWRDAALAYRDLSCSGDSSEAAQQVFDTLRWAEQVAGAERILFPDIDENINCNGSKVMPDALTLAIKDRLTRAASGVVVDRLSDTLQ